MAQAKKSSKKTSAAKQALPTSVDELRQKIAEAENDYIDAKRSNAAGELANPLTIRAQRRQIARLKTALVKQEKETK